MRVAVVGAGVCGLTSVKCCLDEGLEPVCFEKGADLGGLWRYSTTEADHVCVYNSCVMVTSKEMSCFSDYPIPKDYPLYLPRTSVNTYLNLYADNFNLRPYIRFNTKILKITEIGGPNTASNQRWMVTYQKRLTHRDDDQASTAADTGDTTSAEVVFVTETESFDAVLISSGHHWKPRMPKFDGIDDFRGDIIHSCNYKDAKDLHGKNVLVIGIGDSGAHIACEVSQHGGQVYLSTRRGTWITSRLQAYGIPTDQFFLRRCSFDLPRKLLDWVGMKLVNFRFDHHDFGLLPSNSYLEQPVIINDNLPYQIMSGLVLVKPDVDRLTAREVHFKDGSVVDNLDVIILATGYEYDFPFLKEECVKFKDNSPILYKYMFRVEENPTLAFIGFLQPVGSTFSIAEIQARVATRLFKGLAKLPDVRDMEREIEERMERKKKESYDAKRHATTVYSLRYCDELADIIGCKPRFGGLLFTDPRLAYRLYFGPCSPPQYRLSGPGAWHGARQAIMELPERNVYQMKKKEVSQSSSFKLVLSAAVGLFIIYLLLHYVFI